MAKWVRTNGVQPPCVRDCPGRKPGCGAECEKWQEYITKREALYKQRHLECITNGAIADGYRRMGGTR